jgi:hypothetical protein
LNDPNTNNVNISIPTRLQGFADDSFVSEVTSKFIESTFGAILNPASWLAMPASSWTVVCIIFFTLWAYLSGKTNFARNFAIGLTLLVTTFGYLAVILYSYLTVFGPGEAAALASFPRYAATWYHGVFFAIVLLILSEVDFGVYVKSNQIDAKSSGSINRQKHIGVLLVAFICLNTISSLGYYVFMLRSSPILGIDWREPLFKTTKAIKAAQIPDGSKVYIVTNIELDLSSTCLDTRWLVRSSEKCLSVLVPKKMKVTFGLKKQWMQRNGPRHYEILTLWFCQSPRKVSTMNSLLCLKMGLSNQTQYIK